MSHCTCSTTSKKKKSTWTWYPLLMPVILAPQEVEIRRIVVQSQLDWAKSYQDPILTNNLGMVACDCHPSHLRSINR
jgi:hypothetical protein